jgi:RNA-splicing ligase RtcB
MIEVKGKYNDAIIYSDRYDDTAYEQILDFCNLKSFSGAQICVMPDYHAGKGCVVGFTASNVRYLIPNVIGVDIGCLDKDTEILTPNGWKKISEYDGEQILIYDKNTDSARFSHPLLYIKKPCEDFYYLNTDGGLDQCVSAEHKILAWIGIKGKGYKLRDYTAKDFVEHHNSLKKGISGGIKTTFNVNSKGLGIEDIKLRLMIMVSADGHINNNVDGSQWIELHFRKERKIKRAIKLLKQAGIDYRISVWKDGTSNIRFRGSENEYVKDLSFLYQCNSNELKVVIDEIKYWDGTVRNNKTRFSTSLKCNADAIQYAFAASGVRAGISVITYDNGWNPTYNVYETLNDIVRFPEHKIETVKSVDGLKYCFTTDTGYFVIRRNSKISITGNCGILAVKLNKPIKNLEKLDMFINEFIPSGFDVNEKIQEYFPLKLFRCCDHFHDTDRLRLSLGSLGGGNHFIEVDIDNEGNQWLLVHSGSRNLGNQVAKYYQSLAEKIQGDLKEQIKFHIQTIEPQKRQEWLLQFKEDNKLPKGLEHLTGEYLEEYKQDMYLACEFASLNRLSIAERILNHFNVLAVETVESIHNYYANGTIRKGAISARAGESVVIPLNMRDGCIIGEGKGNPDWNFSAPHGAGRIMSRSEAKEKIDLKDYMATMDGIYTTSVNNSTIDEAPMAYKPAQEIIDAVKDTVKIKQIIKPIYNFKA